MSQKSPLTQAADVRYIYDGTLTGFYSCVHESVYTHEFPLEILPMEQAEHSLLSEKFIVTDPEKSKKVRASVSTKISPRARSLLEMVFLSCLPEKELHLLRFLLYGYESACDISQRLAEPCVAILLEAENHLLRERHLLLGFVRFSDYDGLLAATITPKNFVLPLLRTHFVGRYPNENFVIVDKTHRYALLYQNKVCELIPVEQVNFPPPGQQEERYRTLWKSFYNTIAITSRSNDACRMTHMPKRYWENMLEVSHLLSPTSSATSEALHPASLLSIGSSV